MVARRVQRHEDLMGQPCGELSNHILYDDKQQPPSPATGGTLRRCSEIFLRRMACYYFYPACRSLPQTRHIEHFPRQGIPGISPSPFSGPGVESTPAWETPPPFWDFRGCKYDSANECLQELRRQRGRAGSAQFEFDRRTGRAGRGDGAVRFREIDAPQPDMRPGRTHFRFDQTGGH